MCATTVQGQAMTFIAGIGLATTLLEVVATSIGFGLVVAGFSTSCVGFLRGRTRKEAEAEALKSAFIGGVAGICCLCFDVVVGYTRWF
jgi:hypothetical protein